MTGLELKEILDEFQRDHVDLAQVKIKIFSENKVKDITSADVCYQFPEYIIRIKE